MWLFFVQKKNIVGIVMEIEVIGQTWLPNSWLTLEAKEKLLKNKQKTTVRRNLNHQNTSSIFLNYKNIKKNFGFWNTPNQTACDGSTKHISQLEIKTSQKMFCCWACQQYMSVANSNNKVTKGTFYLFYTIPKLFCLCW